MSVRFSYVLTNKIVETQFRLVNKLNHINMDPLGVNVWFIQILHWFHHSLEIQARFRLANRINHNSIFGINLMDPFHLKTWHVFFHDKLEAYPKRGSIPKCIPPNSQAPLLLWQINIFLCIIWIIFIRSYFSPLCKNKINLTC